MGDTRNRITAQFVDFAKTFGVGITSLSALKTEERLVEIWNVDCRAGKHKSQTYVIAGDSYGRLLGRTLANEIAEFNSWENPAFD